MGRQRTGAPGSGTRLASGGSWLGAGGGWWAVLKQVQLPRGPGACLRRRSRGGRLLRPLRHRGPPEGPPPSLVSSAPVPVILPRVPPKLLSLCPSSDPPALPSLRPTAAPISEEKRGPYKDDTEQTVCFPEDTGPRPPSVMVPTDPRVWPIFLEEMRGQDGQPHLLNTTGPGAVRPRKTPLAWRAPTYTEHPWVQAVGRQLPGVRLSPGP